MLLCRRRLQAEAAPDGMLSGRQKVSLPGNIYPGFLRILFRAGSLYLLNLQQVFGMFGQTVGILRILSERRVSNYHFNKNLVIAYMPVR